MLLHLYRSVIRSKLDYGCVVYGSARPSYLRMLDPMQNHALRLCLGAFRTSPCPSLSVEANEPPLNLRRQKLSVQYALRLSSNYQNPAYNVVFNRKFGRFFSEQTQSDSSTWHSCIIWSSCSRLQKEIHCTINHHSYSVATQPPCGWSQTSLLGQRYYSSGNF